MTLGCGPRAQGRGWARTEKGEVRSRGVGRAGGARSPTPLTAPSEPRQQGQLRTGLWRNKPGQVSHRWALT